MISISNLDKISYLFSVIFYYGLTNGYNENFIEEKIIESPLIRRLENDDSFLYEFNTKEILSQIFNKTIKEEELLKTNPLSLWLGEIYVKLFFKFHKTFSFIFLYLPIKKACALFDLYHEMDIDELYAWFNKAVNKTNLLSLLLKRSDLNIAQLCVLTSIKENTIKSYIKNINNLYNAKFEYVARLSNALNVDINIFREHIDNYLNSNAYSYDKQDIEYRHYLGYIISSYFNRDIRRDNFVFNNDVLESKSSKIKVTWTDINSIDFLNKTIRDWFGYSSNNDTYLIIFNYSKDKEALKYKKYLSSLSFKGVIVIDDDYYYEFRKDKVYKRSLTNKLCESSNNIAKNLCRNRISF